MWYAPVRGSAGTTQRPETSRGGRDHRRLGTYRLSTPRLTDVVSSVNTASLGRGSRPCQRTTLCVVPGMCRTTDKGRAMEITEELRTLAKFTSGPIPVISVYLNTQWRDPQQRARVTTFFERHIHQARALEPETAAARESLARDLERLSHWGQHHLQSTGESTMPGVALFACSAADLWVESPSPIPFEDEFTIAHRPTLRQLAHLDED